jgi:peroxiredoxin
MQSLEKNKKIFDKLNTIAVGLSVDSVPCKAAWAKSIKIKQTKLLSDFWPHGNVAESLGLFREQDGISQRANVIIDEMGKVCFVKVYPIAELPDIDEIINFLKNA